MLAMNDIFEYPRSITPPPSYVSIVYPPSYDHCMVHFNAKTKKVVWNTPYNETNGSTDAYLAQPRSKLSMNDYCSLVIMIIMLIIIFTPLTYILFIPKP